jgi:hypothetical protein
VQIVQIMPVLNATLDLLYPMEHALHALLTVALHATPPISVLNAQLIINSLTILVSSAAS